MSSLPDKITTEATESTENTELESYHLGEIQIDGALDMFDQKNYICAITLAGAADSFLASVIKEHGKLDSKEYENSLSTLKKVLSSTYGIQEEDLPDLNMPRNALKHYAEGSCDKEWNIKDCATTEICRAIFNLHQLTERISGRMSRFIKSVNQTSPSAEMDINVLSGKIIDCAIQVHKLLGPGLLESAYQQALAHYLTREEVSFAKEKPIPINLNDFVIEAGYRADFIIDEKIILEIKSVDKLAPIHEAQLLTYMKLGKFPLGILLNFNERLLKDGIKRMRL